MEFPYFSGEYEPDSEKIYKLTRDVEFVVQVLKEAWEPVQTKLTGSKTNCAQNGALAEEYQAGMKKISTYVQVALQLRDLIREPTGRVRPNRLLKSLSLLLYSLGEIERCMHSGAVYTSSGPISKVEESGTTSLDVDDNCSLSMACRLLFQDFSFCLDLVQIAFNRFIFALKILDISENPVAHEISKGIVKEFCNSQPLNLFEWCARSCRPVLKQRFLELGQQVLHHPSVSKVVKEAAAHEGIENLCEELREAKLDLARLSPQMQILEEPGYTLPPEVDIKDVQIIGDLLGEGASGSVFRCKWQDKDMVVKFILLDPGQPKVQENFEKEVSILSSLKHPNAVRIFGFGFTQENRNGFILMEQMEMDLCKIIRDMMIKKVDEGSSVFPIDVSIDLMVQIVEGMCAMECKRVMHRDLKPANILVNRPDKDKKPFERFYQVKLADFGTSKQYNVSDPVFHTRRVGTIAYMAPEVMSDALSEETKIDLGYSWKADVWSFGMVCSEILTAKLPFQYGFLKKTLAAVQGGERPKLDLLDCGDPLRRLVEDCWKFNPKERPGISEVRQRLWECRICHFSEVERPPTSWQPFRTNLYSSYIKSLSLPVTQHIKALKATARSTVGPCHEACLALEEKLESIKPGVERIEVQMQELCKRFPKARLDFERVEEWLEKLKEAIEVASAKVHEYNSEPRLKCESSSTIAKSEVLKSMQSVFEDPIVGMQLQLQELCKFDPDGKLGLQARLQAALQTTLKKFKEEVLGASIKLHESNDTVEVGDLKSYELSKEIMAQTTKITELSKEQEIVTLPLRNAQLRADNAQLLAIVAELRARYFRICTEISQNLY